MFGICINCKKPCKVIITDFGIGLYDYCGAKGNDIQLKAVSECCEAPAYIEYSGEFITVEMLKDEKFINY